MAHSSPLVSVAQLQAWLQDDPASVLVLDASFDLANPASGKEAFLAGHIPGAAHIDLNDSLSSTPTGLNGRHPLPRLEDFVATLARLGASHDTRIVVYDRQGAMFAARAWWLLRWAGHQHAFVLDGGLQAWTSAGLPTQTGPATQRAGGDIQARATLVGTVDYEALRARIGAEQAPVILDARAPDRFRGENETLDPVGGHIPGARNRFFRDNLREDGRFREPGELHDAFSSLLGSNDASDAVMQCGSGVTACHNLLALEVAGLPGARLYPGSWSEWSSRPHAPIATGT